MAHHFGQTLVGTKWQHLKGWHVFRYSAASIMASEGVDQRIIDEVLGHVSEEMRLRYAHLFPNKVKQSIVAAFC